MVETYAVARNGAVWNCYKSFDVAKDLAQQASRGCAHVDFQQGFDDTGRSAVVGRPVYFTVEALPAEGGIYRRGRVVARFRGGVEQEVANG